MVQNAQFDDILKDRRSAFEAAHEFQMHMDPQGQEDDMALRGSCELKRLGVQGDQLQWHICRRNWSKRRTNQAMHPSMSPYFSSSHDIRCVWSAARSAIT